MVSPGFLARHIHTLAPPSQLGIRIGIMLFFFPLKALPEKIIDILTWCKILTVVHTNYRSRDSPTKQKIWIFWQNAAVDCCFQTANSSWSPHRICKMRSVTVDGGESGRRGAMERIQDWFLRSSQPLNTNQADEVLMVYQLFVFCWFSLKSLMG